MIHPILALHGFLGKASDWDLLELDDTQGIELNAFPLDSMWGWAKAFNQFLQEETNNLHYHKKPVLMGYSFGGRLALHALIENPSLYHAGIIVSSHPGLSNQDEKAKRLQSDQEWSERFLVEDWDTLMASWNSREVFVQSSFTFDRREEDYDRQSLADQLRNCSLGTQEDLREKISQLPMPLFWIVGKRDKLYVDIAKEMNFKNINSRVIVMPECGHRAPWEQPALFRSLC